jgi:hypothetical protein
MLNVIELQREAISMSIQTPKEIGFPIGPLRALPDTFQKSVEAVSPLSASTQSMGI